MKLIRNLLAGATLTALTASSAFAADAKVTIGDLTWTGASAIGHVIKAIIEGPMGGEAEIVEGLSDGGAIAAGMDKGDGTADVYTDLWMPNRQGIWDKYIDGAKSVGTNIPYKGTQMIYVPTYMADKGVKTILDLAKPEVAAMFDKDGNGKGEYWAGAEGWKSTKMWQVKFKSYGLDELWEPEILEDATFKGQLKASIQKEEPILFYYWTPEWVHAAYDITPIQELERVEGCESHDLDAEDWLEVSHFNCAATDATIYVAYSKSLEDRNPAAAKFLSQMKLDPAVVNQWILQIGRDKEDPQDVAEAWVADNMDIVKAWIE